MDGAIFGSKAQPETSPAVGVVNPPQGMEGYLGGLLPNIFSRLKAGGLAWAAYPKGGSKVSTDLNRDILWKLIELLGWRPVRMVALDETWSAMRFKGDEGS